jgi:hypothetical protein
MLIVPMRYFRMVREPIESGTRALPQAKDQPPAHPSRMDSSMRSAGMAQHRISRIVACQTPGARPVAAPSQHCRVGRMANDAVSAVVGGALAAIRLPLDHARCGIACGITVVTIEASRAS